MSIDFNELGDPQAQIVSEINTTPLVDVMLVLLIIFLIAVPVINTSVAVRLPREANALRITPPTTAIVSIDSTGGIFWFDARVVSGESLARRLQDLASQSRTAEIQIRGDAGANFEAVASVLNAARAAGITRIGFITDAQE